MPQMAPLSWLTLFIIFSIIMLLFNSMNYFSFTPSLPLKTKLNKKFNYYSFKWKW